MINAAEVSAKYRWYKGEQRSNPAGRGRVGEFDRENDQNFEV